MTPREEGLRKINIHLRLTAEDLGYRAIIAILDSLERQDVSTSDKFTRALATYRDIAVKLGNGKPAAQRTALLADIVRLKIPQRCFEDILQERRARKVDPLDDLDNDPEEEYGEEDRDNTCECRCMRCLDGNHKRCLNDGYECGQPDSAAWLEAHSEDDDAELRRKLDEIGRKIKREASTREFLSAAQRGDVDLFDYTED